MKNHINFDAALEKCKLLYQAALKKYNEKLDEINSEQYNFEEGAEEFAINSRYMHRGYYCPSPALEHTVVNIKRGTIAKRVTKITRVTNRYIFDTEQKLRIVEEFYNGYVSKTEYIFYEEGKVYGFTIGSDGDLINVSVEQYENEKITSYFWSYCSCSGCSNNPEILFMRYETYHYENEGFLYFSFFDMQGDREGPCTYYKYRFSLDSNGKALGDTMQLLHRESKLSN